MSESEARQVGLSGNGPEDSVMTAEQRELWQLFVQGGWVLHRTLFREIDQSSALSSADWRLLEVLAAAPHLRISDLADRTQIGLSTVSRQVTRFIERGLVVRADSTPIETRQKDARQKWVRITELGLEVVAPILEARDRAVRKLVIDRLTAEKFQQLCSIFGEIGTRIVENDD